VTCTFVESYVSESLGPMANRPATLAMPLNLNRHQMGDTILLAYVIRHAT
jgi:hypothetical protein